MSKNIYDLLKQEHKEAKEILEKLASSSAEDAELRREKGSKVAIALISHNEAESETLYRRLMKFEDMRAHVEEHQSEHEEANEELESLLDMDVEDEAWLDHLKEIKKAVEHHVEDEENKLFPEAQKHLDDKEAETLAKEFEQAQSRRKERLQAA